MSQQKNTVKEILIIILAILLPPVAVFLKTGLSVDLLINIALCFLGFIPGLIHALYIIAKVPAGQDVENEPLLA